MDISTRYRKREPVEVDAVMLTIENIAEAAKWCHGKIIYSGNMELEDPLLVRPVGLKLLTKNRLQVALLGDYIYLDHEDFFHKTSRNEFDFEYEQIQNKENKV